MPNKSKKRPSRLLRRRPKLTKKPQINKQQLPKFRLTMTPSLTPPLRKRKLKKQQPSKRKKLRIKKLLERLPLRRL